VTYFLTSKLCLTRKLAIWVNMVNDISASFGTSSL